jgi:hypothetical protein
MFIRVRPRDSGNGSVRSDNVRNVREQQLPSLPQYQMRNVF